MYRKCIALFPGSLPLRNYYRELPHCIIIYNMSQKVVSGLETWGIGYWKMCAGTCMPVYGIITENFPTVYIYIIYMSQKVVSGLGVGSLSSRLPPFRTHLNSNVSACA